MMTIHKFIKKGKKNNKPYNYDELSQCLFFINALLSPLHPNISKNFLHTVLYTFL